MGEHFLDDLAEALDHATVSRGQTLKLVGAALLDKLFGSVFTPPAAARASSERWSGRREGDGDEDHHEDRGSSRSRCCPRGTFRTTAQTPLGECQCASIGFAEGVTIPCGGRSCCSCTLTIEGEGYCLDSSCTPTPQGSDCISSSQCDPREKCVVNINGGTSCLPPCPATP
jgi:hypothetical protein